MTGTRTSDEESTSKDEPALPYLVVGVGASAGGLKPLQALFAAMEPPVPAAFVVVQHLSSDFESMMGPLLQRKTLLQVETAEDGVVPQPGAVYLLPSGHDITLRDGALRLQQRDDQAGLHLPIDDFLHSLARDQLHKAGAIVLSGAGADGSRGIVSVKQGGGLVLVQDPEEAEFDSMPRMAIDTGLVDFTAPVGEIAQAVMRRATDAPSVIPSGLTNVDSVLSIVRAETGLDLTRYREGTVMRRLNHRIQLLGLSSVEQYVELLNSDPSEATNLKHEILIGVTSLFRDRGVWSFLRSQVLPKLLSRQRAGPLRAWVAACSTGEEAYTLAICILEACRAVNVSPDFKVFATDVNVQALRRASDGVFPASAMEDVPTELRERYFDRGSGGWTIRRIVRERLTFAAHNLLTDPPFTRIDIATLRNVLIYLKPAAQDEVLSRIHFGLVVPKGVLVLGDSGNLGSMEKHFNALSKRQRIYEVSGRAPLHDTLLRSVRPRTGRPPTSERPSEVEELYRTLLRRHAPPGVVVDEKLDVMHIIGDVAPYMSLPEGQLTTNLQRMIAPAASVLVGSAASRALNSGERVTIPGLSLGADVSCDIVVERYARSSDQAWLLVQFQASPPPVEPSKMVDVDQALADRIHQLEAELEKTRRHLRTAVEELETANEELQATNEELVASNEELQSTNEEMQSVNEELYTVNTEYQQKIVELGELSDDLDHLLHNLEVGTVFLDSSLSVRRYNTLATEVVPLLEGDLGRPVTDLAWKVDPEQILDQVRRALRGSETHEIEVSQHPDRHWRVVVRAHHRRSDGVVDGALLTIVDVSREHETARQLREANTLTDAAVRLARVGIMVLDRRERSIAMAGPTRSLVGLGEQETLDYERLTSELTASRKDGSSRRVLTVGRRRLPVRVFVRPTADRDRVVVAFQLITPLTSGDEPSSSES